MSITICSWNDRDDLRVCLDSLRNCAEEARFEVIVVDNNSGDDSGDMVASDFPECVLIRADHNLGFTAGHNLAVERMRGKHWFCLNSDTIVHPGAIRTLVDHLESHCQCAIAAPKLLNTDGSLQFSVRNFPNPVAAAFRNTWLGRLFPNVQAVREYLMQDANHNEVIAADWVSGAAFMMSESALKKVGKFDPAYFMFCEDVDLCWRCHEAGFTVEYVPNAEVTHHIGRATDQAPNRMIGAFHASMFRFYRTRMVPKSNLFARPFLIALAACGLFVRAAGFVARNRLRRWSNKWTSR